MPEAVDSIQLTFVNPGVSPTDSVVLEVPFAMGFLHTVKARMDPGGLMTTGQIRIYDQADIAFGNKDEAMLYDSGVVAWTASPSDTSVADALVPPMPLTSNFQTLPPNPAGNVGKSYKPVIAITPTLASGAWTVTVRLTTSRMT